MATTVYLPLNPLPTGVSGYYREGHPYGPTAAAGFETALRIEVDPAHADPYTKVLAVVGGLVRVIPNGAGTGPVTLVLRPDLGAAADLGAEFGCGNAVFVYRGLDPAAVRAAALPAIKALPDSAPFKDPGTDTEARANRFMAGSFAIAVKAGDEVGKVAVPPAPSTDWAALDFEIALPPAGVGTTTAGPSTDPAVGWKRLVELIAPAATTRRYDPIAFYARTGGKLTLAAGHAGHAVLRIATRRALIEIRDEYDEPFAAPVAITGGTGTTGAAPAGSRGTFVLESIAGEGPAQQVQYGVSVPASRLTELPSGKTAAAAPTKTLSAPAHWALQSIVLDLAPPDETASWLVPNVGLPRFTEGNLVTPIRDGVGLFREYADALRTVKAAGHYAYIIGWRLIDSFNLVQGDATSTIAALTQAAATAGAQVRALLWDQFRTDNNDEVSHINALPGSNGRAILDNETLNFGSHHQKCVIVNGAGGLKAWAGGIDINTDRRDTDKHGATGGFHDVHARVEGPAAGDLHQNFLDRWNNHPTHPTPLLTAPAPPQNVGSHFVQVARTYPAQMHYPFAPLGSTVPLDAVLHAIGRARKYIYVEDQYLTPYPGRAVAGTGDTVGVLTALRAALARIDYLVIVIPNHWDQPQGKFRRQQFIKSLRDAAPQKVFVYYLARPTPTHAGPGEEATQGGCDSCSGGKDHRDEIYCHTKVWIVDDVIAKIGSANMNRRSYTHDSELDLVVLDGAVRDGGRVFARDLRMQLWGEHLNMSGAKNVLLEDYKAAFEYWRTPPTGARIRVYDENTEIDMSNADNTWNNEIDPDGR